MHSMIRRAQGGIILYLLGLSSALAGYVQVGMPLEQLPQDHEYQKTLRAFIGTLAEKDFTVERRAFTEAPSADPDAAYRLWLLPLNLPRLETAALPPAAFTLVALEATPGIRMPTLPHECQMLAWLANWDYPGNPYRGDKAVKRRAFVVAAVDLMMLDYLYEHDPRGAARSDYLGGNLIWIGYTYGVVKDVLPEPVLAAFEVGLKKHVLRLKEWGPRGAMTDMDLFAPVGLYYIARASSDPEIKQIAESFARRLFTEPRYFHPAGYFVDNGCFDTSYNGISLYFGTWAALASDWPFAREAIEKAFRLRAHLCFPDPDGVSEGPSQMSSRTSADPPRDQWNFPIRHQAAAMVTDEALHLAPLPTPEKIAAAPQVVIQAFNAQLGTNYPALSNVWKECHWSGALNFAYEHYRSGAYAQRLALTNSPLMQPLYARTDPFIHEFEKAFVVARFDAYAAVIHTGPVGRPVGHNGLPYGYGGGELSVFWTPASGSVMVGRRRGVQGAVYDSFAEWRAWPVHAVSGLTPDDELVTSTRISQPDVEQEIGKSKCEVRVSGVVPKYNKARTALSQTEIRYARRFEAVSDGLTVETTLTADTAQPFTELYETIPVFLRDLAQNEKAATVIECRQGDAWAPATAEYQDKIKSVRLTRFNGVVTITFSKPRRVKLAPADWKDGFQTQAACRTLLVDLLEGGAQPQALKKASVRYTIKGLLKEDSKAEKK